MTGQKKQEPEIITSIQLDPERYDYLFALGNGDPVEGISVLISEREKFFQFVENLNLGRFSKLAKIALNLKKVF